MSDVGGDGPDWRRPDGAERLDQLPTRADSSLPEPGEVVKALREPHRRFCARRDRSLLLVIQGPDTSGKNSLIRTLSRGLDPAGFRSWSFGPPGREALRHDFLWRASRLLPARGEVVAFNRSYYDCVLAERLWPVEKPVRPPDWAGRHRAIVDFEQRLLDEGTAILKCWLNLSDAEHRRRLERRLRDPRKSWKFDPADLRNFEDRDRYQALASATLAKTGLPDAPWHLIPADSRKEARSIVGGLLRDMLEQLAPEYPPQDDALCERFLARLRGL